MAGRGKSTKLGRDPRRENDGVCPKMNDAELRKDIRARIDRAQHRLLDLVERQLDAFEAPPPAPAAPPAVVRRQLSNTLGLWRFCAEQKCRRARCCRGEPKHCIRYGAPLVPEALALLMPPRTKRRRVFLLPARGER
jgi:hypothetical protein